MRAASRLKSARMVSGLAWIRTLVDENGVTLRGWIDSEDLKLWGPDARVQLAVGNAKVNIEQHTEGRGETSRAMLDLSVPGFKDMVDTIGFWLGVDGSMHAGELPAVCKGAHGSPEDRPRYIMNQMDQSSAEWTLLSSKRCFKRGAVVLR